MIIREEKVGEPLPSLLPPETAEMDGPFESSPTGDEEKELRLPELETVVVAEMDGYDSPPSDDGGSEFPSHTPPEGGSYGHKRGRVKGPHAGTLERQGHSWGGRVFSRGEEEISSSLSDMKLDLARRHEDQPPPETTIRIKEQKDTSKVAASSEEQRTTGSPGRKRREKKPLATEATTEAAPPRRERGGARVPASNAAGHERRPPSPSSASAGAKRLAGLNELVKRRAIDDAQKNAIKDALIVEDATFVAAFDDFHQTNDDGRICRFLAGKGLLHNTSITPPAPQTTTTTTTTTKDGAASSSSSSSAFAVANTANAANAEDAAPEEDEEEDDEDALAAARESSPFGSAPSSVGGSLGFLMLGQSPRPALSGVSIDSDELESVAAAAMIAASAVGSYGGESPRDDYLQLAAASHRRRERAPSFVQVASPVNLDSDMSLAARAAADAGESETSPRGRHARRGDDGQNDETDVASSASPRGGGPSSSAGRRANGKLRGHRSQSSSQAAATSSWAFTEDDVAFEMDLDGVIDDRDLFDERDFAMLDGGGTPHHHEIQATTRLVVRIDADALRRDDDTDDERGSRENDLSDDDDDSLRDDDAAAAAKGPPATTVTLTQKPKKPRAPQRSTSSGSSTTTPKKQRKSPLSKKAKGSSASSGGVVGANNSSSKKDGSKTTTSPSGGGRKVTSPKTTPTKAGKAENTTPKTPKRRAKKHLDGDDATTTTTTGTKRKSSSAKDKEDAKDGDAKDKDDDKDDAKGLGRVLPASVEGAISKTVAAIPPLDDLPEGAAPVYDQLINYPRAKARGARHCVMCGRAPAPEPGAKPDDANPSPPEPAPTAAAAPTAQQATAQQTTPATPLTSAAQQTTTRQPPGVATIESEKPPSAPPAPSPSQGGGAPPQPAIPPAPPPDPPAAPVTLDANGQALQPPPINDMPGAVIPKQNKDVCRECDKATWQHNTTGCYFKWCKGCKRFRNLVAFKGKLAASKCDHCRARGRDGYMRRKDATADGAAETTTKDAEAKETKDKEPKDNDDSMEVDQTTATATPAPQPQQSAAATPATAGAPASDDNRLGGGGDVVMSE